MQFTEILKKGLFVVLAAAALAALLASVSF
jgi:hypothetical protein